MSMSRPVSTLIKRKWRVLKIDEAASVAEAALMMRQNNIGSLLVVDSDGRLAGIITERDILGKVVATLADASETSVDEVMTSEVITVTPDTTLEQAQEIMNSGRMRHLPVTDDGLPMGLLSARDLTEYKLRLTEAMAREQTELLGALEENYPDITHIHRDPATGRVII